MADPENSGFGTRILGTFARTFCQKVDARYGEGGLHYVLQIKSDQIRCAEPRAAAAHTGDSHFAASVFVIDPPRMGRADRPAEVD